MTPVDVTLFDLTVIVIGGKVFWRISSMHCKFTNEQSFPLIDMICDPTAKFRNDFSFYDWRKR